MSARGLVVFFCVVVVADGCDCGAPVACPDAVEFTVDGVVCGGDGEDCVVDFGDVSVGLSSSKRVSVVGRCDRLFFDATISDGDDTFAVGQSAFELGEHFNEGFVFVEAQPDDDAQHDGTLRIDGDESVDLALTVN